jgi:hypothetical protein
MKGHELGQMKQKKNTGNKLEISNKLSQHQTDHQKWDKVEGHSSPSEQATSMKASLDTERRAYWLFKKPISSLWDPLMSP